MFRVVTKEYSIIFNKELYQVFPVSRPSPGEEVIIDGVFCIDVDIGYRRRHGKEQNLRGSGRVNETRSKEVILGEIEDSTAPGVLQTICFCQARIDKGKCRVD